MSGASVADALASTPARGTPHELLLRRMESFQTMGLPSDVKFVAGLIAAVSCFVAEVDALGDSASDAERALAAIAKGGLR